MASFAPRTPDGLRVREASSGKNTFFPAIRLSSLRPRIRVALGFILFSRLALLRTPETIPVRQASGLPRASFRFRLAADTLASGCVLGATSCTQDFHPLERARAERTKKPDRPPSAEDSPGTFSE